MDDGNPVAGELVETERYEAIELILKSPPGEETWFDRIHDLITADCQGSETDACTCGLESMGASSGTYQQCYDWSESLAAGIKPIDLARALVSLSEGVQGKETVKAVTWARKEIEFEAWCSTLNGEEDDDVPERH